jgi:hypothetical protein
VSKFQIKSRTWNLIVIIGSVVLLAIGFGGLFLLQSARSSASTTLWFIVLLGVLTTLFFAGPGIAFVLRKRVAWLKKRLPGDTMAWVRAHLYLPILALVGAWVHASSAPFRSTLTSGKVLLGIAIVVSIAGVARHHLIGVSKAAINADAQISKIAAAQSRQFRQLVIDYKQLRRPLVDIERDVAELSPGERAAWAKVIETQVKIDHDFPRGGGQSRNVRMLKLLRAVHAPLTVVLFLTLSFHVVDVLGTTDTVLADEKENVASVSNCADCHSDIVDDWKASTMAHAQTGTIMEAQLPVTLARNEELARQFGGAQQELYDTAAQVCVNCHAPVGAGFVDDPEAVLPLNEGTDDGPPAVTGGGEAINADGISCTVCHTQDRPFGELAGGGKLNIDGGTRDDYGTVYGPLFRDPNPLPVRVHDIGEGQRGFWDDPIATSIACGACHNVKLDIDGDGLAPGFDEGDTGDDDGDFQLNGNELDNQDGTLDDLVLQTTFDEWQDYVDGFDDTIGATDPEVARPLGCIECHMPSNPDGAKQPVVDKAPGFLPVPDRQYRKHSFIGVDYDLDVAAYTKLGLPPETINEILAERAALLQSAVTLEVVDEPQPDGTLAATVTVRNNLLGHSFPTGFAFARQFWLEVSATTDSGREVCLVDPLADAGIDSPCSSGVLADRSDVLPQCDPIDLARVLGTDRSQMPNGNIDFAEPVPAAECDPWLANFQKILTDGDPDGDGVFREVAFQSFLADIVKLRQRVVDGTVMKPLQSVRLEPDPTTGELAPADTANLVYLFDTAGIDPGERITVTATMHFRHLPPEFIRSLAAEQRDLTNITPSARLDDPDSLIENLVVTDIVTAESGEGEVLACPGPQNEVGATILSCLTEQTGDGAVVLSAAPGHGTSTRPAHPFAEALVVAAFTMCGALVAARGRLGRRSRRGRVGFATAT